MSTNSNSSSNNHNAAWDDLGLSVVVMTVMSISLVHSCGIQTLMDPWQEFPLARSLFFLLCPCPASGGEGKFNHTKSGIWKSISIFHMHSVPSALLCSACVRQKLWYFHSAFHSWAICVLLAGSWIYNESKNKLSVCVGLVHSVLRSVSNPLCYTKAEYNVQQAHEYIKE